MKTTALFIIFSLLSGVALTGCGGMTRPNRIVAPSNTASPSSASGGLLAESASDYDCPNSPNVAADFDYEFNGAMSYTVCVNRAKAGLIEVQTQFSQSRGICVFPAQYIDDMHVYWKPDTTTGRPKSTCLMISATEPAPVSFPEFGFNSVFITTASDLTQMEECLISGSYFSCPHYSYGRFR